ncbi:PAS domain-containing protein [Paracoccus pantotrophus]|uniref:PAS domain-containing protein n=1 Tax=Paracoccus pantotrophus TaxID=82367 RepID=UPI002852E51F|nr:hypothetical protein [Paracoccus pantotrophus]
MVAQFLIAFAAAGLAILLALAALRLADRRLAAAPAARGLERALEPIAFLFRNGTLVDATAPARTLLASLPGDSEWQRLSAWLGMRLPEFGALLPDLGGAARVELQERGGHSPLRLLAEDLGEGLLRLTLADPAAEDAGILVDSLSLHAMEQELEILRSAMDHSPMLAWRQDVQGQVTWANSAYLNLAEAKAQGQTVWPLPRIIDLAARPAQPAAPGGRGGCRSNMTGRAAGMIATCTRSAGRPSPSPCPPMRRCGPNARCANSSRP